MTPSDNPAWPEEIHNEEELDDLLTRPSEALIHFMRTLDGDLMVLGVAGKMGLTLARLAFNAIRAAGVRRRVIGVSRFSSPQSRLELERVGVETIACDFLDRRAVDALPRCENVIFMAGRKFGTEQDKEQTWAANTIVPIHVAEHFTASRICAFSTGCVYPLVPAHGRGCREDDAPEPVGEYAMSCLGRERVFQHFSRTQGTPVCLLRLNYAIDLRYGVLHDIARSIAAGKPVNASVATFNVIWQGDANERAIRSLEVAASPARILNVTGPETLDLRDTAQKLGSCLQRPVTFSGEPGPLAYLNDASASLRLFGLPRVDVPRMIRWTAAWHRTGGRSLGKPTHFEVADGTY